MSEENGDKDSGVSSPKKGREGWEDIIRLLSVCFRSEVLPSRLTDSVIQAGGVHKRLSIRKAVGLLTRGRDACVEWTE